MDLAAAVAETGESGGVFAATTAWPAHHHLAVAWKAWLSPHWAPRLAAGFSARAEPSVDALAQRCAENGVAPDAAICAASLPALAAALPLLHEADVAVVFGALRAPRSAAAAGYGSGCFGGGYGACAPAATSELVVATAPPVPRGGGRGSSVMEARIAAAGAFAVAKSERNTHGAFGAAGGAALLALWKSLQDETTAATAAGASAGVGQDVYFGVLAAAVPLMAGAVALSLALMTASAVAAETDLSAARYLALPAPARYSDVITFAAAAAAAAVSHSFLLYETPQGGWVTWVFVGCAAAAAALASAAAAAILWFARRPFAHPAAAAAEAAAALAQSPTKAPRHARLLRAAATARRLRAARAMAEEVRRAVAVAPMPIGAPVAATASAAIAAAPFLSP